MLWHCNTQGGTSEDQTETQAGDSPGGAAGASPLKESAKRVEDGAAAEEKIVANGQAKGQIINGALKNEGMALLKHNGK